MFWPTVQNNTPTLKPMTKSLKVKHLNKNWNVITQMKKEVIPTQTFDEN